MAYPERANSSTGTYILTAMKSELIVGSIFILLCVSCTPVVSRAPIKSTPDETVACAGGLLGSMGYQILDREDDVRAERAKHAAFGTLRADYDRITVAVIDAQLRVRGETVAMSGGGNRAAATRGAVERSAGGTTATWPSKELRADVKRITA